MVREWVHNVYCFLENPPIYVCLVSSMMNFTQGLIKMKEAEDNKCKSTPVGAYLYL